MRNLSRKQKNMLRKYVKERYFEQNEVKPMFFDGWNDLPYDSYWDIHDTHCFENFDSCVDSFVNDIKTINDCKVI